MRYAYNIEFGFRKYTRVMIMETINLENLKKALENVCDVRYRKLNCRFCTVYIVFSASMSDVKQISDFVIRPLLQRYHRFSSVNTLLNGILQSSSVKLLDSLDGAVDSVLSGAAVVLLPHLNQAVCCQAQGYVKRAIDIPQTETVIKGPREGFTEDIKSNLSEIRRRVRSPKLKMESYSLGTETHTETVLVYLEGVTPQKLLDYVREKISRVEKKYVFYTNYLEEELKCKYTPFDTIGYTEKPDVAVSKLSEGRVLIVMDGNPIVITAPTFFIENFQTTDDYTLNPIMANMGRAFRWVAFFMSTFIPGLYLALVTYHFKLVPNIFLYRLALFRAGVPVPTFVELLYMILFFQIIREAGVRLPQPIGPTLSIVGALILGEAAVTSGLASQITVVVVAITSIASYLVPVVYAPIFVWSVGIVFISSLIGLPGFYMGFVLFVAHIAGLTSCGYPYLYPFGTRKSFRYNDIFMRGDLQSEVPEPLAKPPKKQ